VDWPTVEDEIGLHVKWAIAPTGVSETSLMPARGAPGRVGSQPASWAIPENPVVFRSPTGCT
jgi:hypothetical protein